jgi:hypothetical protein
MTQTGFHADSELLEMPTVPFVDLLKGAVERKAETGTWKEWCWPQTGETFRSLADFREHLFKSVYTTSQNSNWEDALPREINGNQAESKEEAALRARMAEVWKEVNEETRKQAEAVQDGSLRPAAPMPGGGKPHSKRVRSTQEEIILATKEFHGEMIVKMMAAMAREHDLLYQLVAHPIIQFIVATLPEECRETRFQVRRGRTCRPGCHARFPAT